MLRTCFPSTVPLPVAERCTVQQSARRMCAVHTHTQNEHTQTILLLSIPTLGLTEKITKCVMDLRNANKCTRQINCMLLLYLETLEVREGNEIKICQNEWQHNVLTCIPNARPKIISLPFTAGRINLPDWEGNVRCTSTDFSKPHHLDMYTFLTGPGRKPLWTSSVIISK